jgi:hypothetical protein
MKRMKMADPNYTAIAIVADHSGSVSSMKEEMTNSINNFVKEQAKLPGELNVILAEFDEHYDVVYDIKGKEFPEYKVVPRGMTALLDAVGKTINNLDVKILQMKEEDRPSKVLIVVVTDGLENASQEYTTELIKNMIERQKTVKGWEFIFLAANQDAILTGEKYGFARDSSLTYNTTNVEKAFESTSGLAFAYRSGKQVSFTEEDRNKAK